jgi:hypothetical protein
MHKPGMSGPSGTPVWLMDLLQSCWNFNLGEVKTVKALQDKICVAFSQQQSPEL